MFINKFKVFQLKYILYLLYNSFLNQIITFGIYCLVLGLFNHALQLLVLCIIKCKCDLGVINWEGYGKKWPWPILRCHLSKCLEKLWKTT
jgi:hypothetical protein